MDRYFDNLYKIKESLILSWRRIAWNIIIALFMKGKRQGHESRYWI